MSYLIKPAKYKAILNLPQTEMGIKVIKEFFRSFSNKTFPQNCVCVV